MSELVRDAAPAASPHWWEKRERSPLPQYVIAVVVVLGVALLAQLVRPLLGIRAIALVFLLAVVVLALFVGRGPILLAAAMSALSWDFFFLEPIANLHIKSAEDAMMFGTYVVVALVVGQLTARIRAQEEMGRQREEHASALYALTRELAEATNLDGLLQKAVCQIEQVFHVEAAILLPGLSGRLDSHPAGSLDLAGPEQPMAGWVFEHGQVAGKFSKQFPEAETLFVPLRGGTDTLGVMGLRLRDGEAAPSLQNLHLLDAFAQQIGLALERYRLRAQSENNRLLAESERLSKTLLDSMSHEIRTPLAAIQGALGNLSELTEPKLSAGQQAMLAELQVAAGRLNRLVGKVLDITRLESGTVKPRLAWCDVADLMSVAVKETRDEFRGHRLEVDLAPNLPLVRMDFVLVQEALKNLLSNAALHTSSGTSVVVSARVRDEALLLSVADRGAGIAADSLPHIFDKFYRAPGASTGGTGLGLSVVKGFIEAQGGQVQAENRVGGGVLFTIRLPCSTLPQPKK